MRNGRCRLHSGLSTGPRTPRGSSVSGGQEQRTGHTPTGRRRKLGSPRRGRPVEHRESWASVSRSPFRPQMAPRSIHSRELQYDSGFWRWRALRIHSSMTCIKQVDLEPMVDVLCEVVSGTHRIDDDIAQSASVRCPSFTPAGPRSPSPIIPSTTPRIPTRRRAMFEAA